MRKGSCSQIVAIVILLVAGTGVVYVAGGTQYAWLHVMYIPIILSAAWFYVPGAIIAGLCAGVLLGPCMPLDASTMTMQAVSDWIIRAAFFVFIAFFAGCIAEWRKRQIQKAEQQSFVDPFSGLPNFRALCEEIRRVKRNGSTPIVAVIDLINAREIINTLGYQAAPVLLEQFVGRLRTQCVRDVFVARLQEERFAIFSAAMHEKAFLDVCQSIVKSFEKPLSYNTVPVSLLTAVGISTAHGCGDPEDFIQKASIAAHIAFEREVSFVVYSETDDAHNTETLRLLGSLHNAIHKPDLALYYQPKILLKDDSVIGAEALIRWIHPVDGIIPPNNFIPDAEKTWLVHPLSLFAMRTGLNKLRAWREQGLDLTLAVNLTASNIQNTSFIEEILAMISEYDRERHNLEVEITERTIMSDLKEAQRSLEMLKERGVHISIDDFGTGYSRIHFIDELPIDTVKIDMRFIRDLPQSQFNQTVVQHIVKITKDLGVLTVAEGVEDKETYALLKEFDCDVVQGYYVSRPLPEKDFAEWLKTGGWALKRTCR